MQEVISPCRFLNHPFSYTKAQPDHSLAFCFFPLNILKSPPPVIAQSSPHLFHSCIILHSAAYPAVSHLHTHTHCFQYFRISCNAVTTHSTMPQYFRIVEVGPRGRCGEAGGWVRGERLHRSPAGAKPPSQGLSQLPRQEAAGACFPKASPS